MFIYYYIRNFNNNFFLNQPKMFFEKKSYISIMLFVHMQKCGCHKIDLTLVNTRVYTNCYLDSAACSTLMNLYWQKYINERISKSFVYMTQSLYCIKRNVMARYAFADVTTMNKYIDTNFQHIHAPQDASKTFAIL